MTEKTSGKKDHQKNKKQKQNENKKNQSNHTKHEHEVSNKAKQQKKKPNNNKNHVNNHNVKSNKFNNVNKKKSGSFVSFLESLFITLFFSFLFLGFLYVVDYEKFSKIRDGAGSVLNKFVSLLPPAVVSKGREAYEFIRPTAELTASKVSGFMNQTSTFLNTNPLVKDHWANVRDIGSICSARMVDYMRTLYLQITGYCNAFKSKLF